MGSGGARVESLEALKEFKTALLKFAVGARTALSDAESEMQRVQLWLEGEQRQYWQSQIRKRHEIVEKCKEAVRMKKLYKDASGRIPSAVDEEKALSIARKREEEAEQKAINVKRSIGRLQKEIDLYKGSVQKFATSMEVDAPVAAAKLEAMVRTLLDYIALAPEVVEAAPVVVGGDDLVQSEAAPAKQAQEEEPLPPVDSAQLRDGAPSAEARSAAPPADIRMAQWRAGTVTAAQREGMVAFTPAAPASEEGLTLAMGCWTGRAIALVRCPSAYPGDSGWHVTRADGAAAGETRSARVADLLDLRPDLRGLLALPPGSVAVVGPAGLLAAFDADDQGMLKGA